MYELLPEYLLSNPGRMVGLGRGLARTGSLILMIGEIGHVATTATSIVQAIGKHGAGSQPLAVLYPSLPTWWVPESIIGCLPYLFLVAVGIALAAEGRTLQRIYH